MIERILGIITSLLPRMLLVAGAAIAIHAGMAWHGRAVASATSEAYKAGRLSAQKEAEAAALAAAETRREVEHLRAKHLRETLDAHHAAQTRADRERSIAAAAVDRLRSAIATSGLPGQAADSGAAGQAADSAAGAHAARADGLLYECGQAVERLGGEATRIALKLNGLQASVAAAAPELVDPQSYRPELTATEREAGE